MTFFTTLSIPAANSVKVIELVDVLTSLLLNTIYFLIIDLGCFVIFGSEKSSTHELYAQDQPEELSAISVVHTYKLSEKSLRQNNPIRRGVQWPWMCLKHQQLSMHTCRLSYLLEACYGEGKEDQFDELQKAVVLWD